MRTKLLILASAGLAIIIGCVETTSVEAPSEINPNTPFQVIVNTVQTDSGGNTVNGCLSSMIPETWTIDSVYVSGYGFAGSLEMMGWEGFPSDSYPPSPGYGWFDARHYGFSGQSGDTGYAVVTIIPDDSLGTFQLAFLAAVKDPMKGGYLWEGDPCSCIVEVLPLSLEQETWAHIKSEF